MENKIRALRESTGMNRKDFCAFMNIPYRTVTDWELGQRRLRIDRRCNFGWIF